MRDLLTTKLSLKKEDNNHFFYYIIHLVWMILLLAITCGSLLFFTATHSHSYEITHCYDGDTCYLRGPDKLRIAGVNTPEIRGKCAKKSKLAILARDNLNNLVKNAKHIDIRVFEVDVYGRLVCKLYIDGTNYTNIIYNKPWYSTTKKNWCKEM